jgi:hypothetical protein
MNAIVTTQRLSLAEGQRFRAIMKQGSHLFVQNESRPRIRARITR